MNLKRKREKNTGLVKKTRVDSGETAGKRGKI